MQASPDLMKLMGGGGAKPGAAQPASGAPVTAGMTNPQQDAGRQQAAMIDIGMAMDMLERALPAFGSETDEGMALMESLQKLNKKFGEKRGGAKDLMPAELQQLMAGMGKQSPEMQAMAGGGGQPGAQPQAMAA